MPATAVTSIEAMKHFTFELPTSAPGPIKMLPAPKLVRLPLTRHQLLVKAGDNVLKGQAVARSVDAHLGDMHAPFAGVVTATDGRCVELKAEGEGQVDSLWSDAPSGESLGERLRRAGADLPFDGQVRHLIINAVPAEPGMPTPVTLLAHHRATIAAGLELARHLTKARQVSLAAVAGDAAGLGHCAVTLLPPKHPAGCAPLVVKAVTGREFDEDVQVVSVAWLWSLGRIVETGLPVTRTVLDVHGRTLAAVVGTPWRWLAEQTGIVPAEGDRVVAGGPLCGEALYDLESGLNKDATGLTLVPAGTYPPMRDAACIHCGECLRHCPARIQPGPISQAAEFRLFDRARAWGVEACMECGLCGYWCPGRRPLLQYIRLAKRELARAGAQTEAKS